MKKPIYKQDWFWYVGMPTVLVAGTFILSLVIRGWGA